MWTQFVLINIHFAIYIASALVFFLVGWLYLDAWLVNKRKKEMVKISGYFMVALSFLIHSTHLDSSLIRTSLLGFFQSQHYTQLLSLFGYLLIAFGVYLDPIEEKPETEGITEKLVGKRFTNKKHAVFVFSYLSVSKVFLSIFIPLAAFAAGLLYLRRAGVGLEKHLRIVSLSFFVLFISELLAFPKVFENSTDITLRALSLPYGIVWVFEHAFFLAAIIILGKWVISYLLTRIQTQLFIVFLSSVILIFTMTTLTFTLMLLKNIEYEVATQLETDVKVLNYAIEAKKSEILSDSIGLAQNPQTIDLLKAQKHEDLGKFAENFFYTKNLSTAAVTDENGKVVARAEEKERVGDTLSDSLSKRAILGESIASVVSKEAVLPQIMIIASSPVRFQDRVIGTVQVGTVVDNAMLDNIKRLTGLESLVFSGEILSATSLTDGSYIKRPLGIVLADELIKKTVLKEGKNVTAPMTFLNTEYINAIMPLKDIDNEPVGILVVGREYTLILQTAARSIELTFIIAAALIVLSLIPSYLISKSISKQVS